MKRVKHFQIALTCAVLGFPVVWEHESTANAAEPNAVSSDTQGAARRPRTTRIARQIVADLPAVGEATPAPVSVGDMVPRAEEESVIASQRLSGDDGALANEACDECECATTGWRSWLSRLGWNLRGRPESYTPPEFGVSVIEARNAQIRNGYAEQMVMYQYDFIDSELPHAEKLKPEGRRRLKRLLPAMSQFGLNMVVEESGNALLDQRRRKEVVDAIRSMGTEVDARRVISGQGLRGLPHVESTELNRLIQANSSGSMMGSGIRSGINTTGLSGSGLSSGGTTSGFGTGTR